MYRRTAHQPGKPTLDSYKKNISDENKKKHSGKEVKRAPGNKYYEIKILII